MFIKLIDIRKRYEGETILDKISFTAGYGDKIGLIGKNGAGKSTLLKLIAGIKKPTSGKMVKDPLTLRILYFQQVILDVHKTIKDFILASIPQLGVLKEQLDMQFNLDIYAQYEALGGFLIESKIPFALKKVSLEGFSEETLIASLSGGERTRLQLAPIFLSRPDILLLDEPTNHLDIQGIELLETYIKQYRGIIIIATHDKALLRNAANRIIEIDKGHLFDVKGDYDIFLREKTLQEEKEKTTYKEKQLELKKLKTNLEKFETASFLAESGKRIVRKDNDKMGFNYLAEKAAKKFARRAEVINNKLRSFEELQKPALEWQMKLDLNDSQKNKIVFVTEHISKSYNTKKILDDFSYTFYSDKKIILTGANGSGKTTLIKILHGDIEPDTGIIKRNDTVDIGYLSQDHLEIDNTKTIIEDFLHDLAVEESQARTYLHKFLFKDFEVYRKIHTFSQGEKAKYAFAKMLFNKPQFLLLDEPTNYMDIQSKTIIEKALASYEGGFLLATHDRNLIAKIQPEQQIKL